jgi:hypothetical protein
MGVVAFWTTQPRILKFPLVYATITLFINPAAEGTPKTVLVI